MGYLDDLYTIAKTAASARDVVDKVQHKSMARGALDGTLQFPCLVSDSIPIDMASTVARTLERVYASFTQTYLSMNNTIDISIDKNPNMFLKRFHHNIKVESTELDLYNEYCIESDEDYNRMMERIYNGTTKAYINEKENRMILFNFSDKFNHSVFESNKDLLEESLAAIDFTPFPNIGNSPFYEAPTVNVTPNGGFTASGNSKNDAKDTMKRYQAYKGIDYQYDIRKQNAADSARSAENDRIYARDRRDQILRDAETRKFQIDRDLDSQAFQTQRDLNSQTFQTSRDLDSQKFQTQRDLDSQAFQTQRDLNSQAFQTQRDDTQFMRQNANALRDFGLNQVSGSLNAQRNARIQAQQDQRKFDNDVTLSKIRAGQDLNKEKFKLQAGGNITPPSLLKDTDIKKSNDLQPYLMQVRLMGINDQSEFVQFIDFVVGVKVVLHNVKSQEMIDNLQNCLQNNGVVFNFIRWTTGEKSLFKDLILHLNDVKLDVANRSKGSSPWWLTLKHLKDTSRAQAAFFSRTQLVPESTIVISSYEADIIQKNYGFDLRNPKFVLKLMKDLFLMNFVIVDEGTRTIDVLYDGETSYQTYALETLEREVTASSNKIGRELTRMISR